MKLTVLLLVLGLLSCTSTKSTPAAKSTDAPPAKAPVDPQLVPPQTVRSLRVQNDNHGVKTLTMGNADGEYVLSCDIAQETCVTPLPGKDYYLFTKTTKWKFSGATKYATLEFFQDFTISYNNAENIALIPTAAGDSQVGMYWLSSWTAADAKTKQ